MPRLRTYLFVAGATSAARYDSLPGLLLGGFHGSVAADVARRPPVGAQVLEIGAGPGHLATRALATRARANAEHAISCIQRRPKFVPGQVAAPPFPDAALDLVVSTPAIAPADRKAGVA
jgi:hypothetical protein